MAKRKSAAGRALKSLPKSDRKRMVGNIAKLNPGMSRGKVRKYVGGVTRRQRLAKGLNPNTGGRIKYGDLKVKALRKFAPQTRQAFIRSATKSGARSMGAIRKAVRTYAKATKVAKPYVPKSKR